MPAHTDSQTFPYTTQQLYNLVAKVEDYPEFIPWVRASRILERHESYFTAELVVCFKSITEKYTSKVMLTPPHSDNGPCRIDVELVSGPFSFLENHWQFEPTDSGGCTIRFSVDFCFKSRLLDKLIGSLFSRATQKMVSAFSSRAHSQYGDMHSQTSTL